MHLSHYDACLRWLYRGGRPNRFARVQNRMSANRLCSRGLAQACCDLRSARKAKRSVISFPVVIAVYEGERYLVAMLGEKTNCRRTLQGISGDRS